MMEQNFQPENTPPQTATIPAAAVTEIVTDAQTDLLISQRLNAITSHTKRSLIRSFMRMGGIVVFISLGGFVANLFFGQQGLFGTDEFLRQWMQFLYIATGYAGFPLNFWLWRRSGPKFDAEDLARTGGVRAIPALFAALDCTASENQKRAIHSALTILMPQMKADDALQLTGAARTKMRQWAFSRSGITRRGVSGPELTAATLKAMGQIGNASFNSVCGAFGEQKAPQYL